MGERRHTREQSGIRLDRFGRFFHDGEPVEHPKVAAAFHRGLERAEDGRYLIRFGNDWAYIEVEDAPFFVRSLGVRQDPERVELLLSNSETVTLDPSTLALSEDGVLYARVHGGKDWARFDPDAHFLLGDMLEERAERYLLRLGGREHPIELRSNRRAP